MVTQGSLKPKGDKIMEGEGMAALSLCENSKTNSSRLIYFLMARSQIPVCYSCVPNNKWAKDKSMEKYWPESLEVCGGRAWRECDGVRLTL